VEGLKTTAPFHKFVINNDKFKSGNFDTHFLEEIGDFQLDNDSKS